MDGNPTPDIKVLAGIPIAATARDPVISAVQGPWHFSFKSETASPELENRHDSSAEGTRVRLSL